MGAPKHTVGGRQQASQASPATDSEPTAIALVLEPTEPTLLDERPDDVRTAVRSACGSVRLDDVEIKISDVQVSVSATNPTAFTPSRVLHNVWSESVTNWGAIAKPRDVAPLAWKRGDILDEDTDRSRISKLFG